MSRGGTMTLAPSSLAFAVLASQSATWKYGIQYDGTCAGMSAGIGIMPAPGWPWLLNSVYSIPALGALCFGVQPKSPV